MTSLTTRPNEGGETRPTTFSRMFVGRPPSLAEVLAARNRALAGVVERPAIPVEAPVETAVTPSPQPSAPEEDATPAAPPAPAAVPAPMPARTPSASTQAPRSESRMHGFPRRRRAPRVHYPVPAPPTERQVERLVEQTVERPVERTVFRDPQPTAVLVVTETVTEPVTETEPAAADQIVTETYPASDEVARMVRGESLSPEQLMNSLLSSMHRVVVARRQHHRAVEDELYRRADLIRAEAEVDAEFIRMRAYVDALSIVSAAQRSIDGPAANDSWTSSIAPLAELIAKLHQETG